VRHINLGIEIPASQLATVLRGEVYERVVRDDETKTTCTVHLASNGKGGLQIMLRLHTKGSDGDPAESWKG
jgi:hypothetical protein